MKNRARKWTILSGSALVAGLAAAPYLGTHQATAHQPVIEPIGHGELRWRFFDETRIDRNSTAAVTDVRVNEAGVAILIEDADGNVSSHFATFEALAAHECSPELAFGIDVSVETLARNSACVLAGCICRILSTSTTTTTGRYGVVEAVELAAVAA